MSWDGDHGEGWLDEGGGGRVGVAAEGELGGNIELSCLRFLEGTEGEDLAGGEDGGGWVALRE